MRISSGVDSNLIKKRKPLILVICRLPEIIGYESDVLQCKLNNQMQRNLDLKGGREIYRVEIVASRTTLGRRPQNLRLRLQGKPVVT